MFCYMNESFQLYKVLSKSLYVQCKKESAPWKRFHCIQTKRSSGITRDFATLAYEMRCKLPVRIVFTYSLHCKSPYLFEKLLPKWGFPPNSLIRSTFKTKPTTQKAMNEKTTIFLLSCELFNLANNSTDVFSQLLVSRLLQMYFFRKEILFYVNIKVLNAVFDVTQVSYCRRVIDYPHQLYCKNALNALTSVTDD